MLRGLFEGAQYDSEAGAKCAVYSRARTKQGRGVIKEIRYLIFKLVSIKSSDFLLLPASHNGSGVDFFFFVHRVQADSQPTG